MCQRKELFCFTAFTRKKKDGGIRTILNLIQLNKHWNPNQMFSKIIQPTCWMASADLKDAFYTIPIHNAYEHCSKLICYQRFYNYVGMPNGHSNAMGVINKILKPPLTTLRKQGFFFCHIC